jgi:hypothetical protein
VYSRNGGLQSIAMADSSRSSSTIDPDLLEFLNGSPPCDSNGVDMSSIRANLAMTLEQRSEAHCRAADLANELRRMGEKRYGPLRSDPSPID